MKLRVDKPHDISCPKCDSKNVIGMHKETVDTFTGKIVHKDKTIKYYCLSCKHKFWRKRKDE